MDDYTFVVETVGLNDKTWLDNAGRPHSDQLRVEERFHRPSREILELTVTIDDPKFYTKPWVAADKLIFHLLPADFDMGEILVHRKRWRNTRRKSPIELLTAANSPRFEIVGTCGSPKLWRRVISMRYNLVPVVHPL